MCGWSLVGGWDSSGSAAGNWDWKTGLHIGGNLRLVDYLKHGVSEQQVGIFPDKIAIYLTAPVKITKDTLIRLAWVQSPDGLGQGSPEFWGRAVLNFGNAFDCDFDGEDALKLL